ncbi:hypothetical protein NDU88_001663 [Pleurodeles waltl]|uniref:Uncharacterized protein n=1 Tax=Pleurodeles waltl TaxID=8319 RepID=A0AAV7NFT0_PLEWA|nr:hypothetical protein NDU88_001663 [Pleurodeles waltl]
MVPLRHKISELDFTPASPDATPVVSVKMPVYDSYYVGQNGKRIKKSAAHDEGTASFKIYCCCAVERAWSSWCE